jgi:ribose 5-phosphate isomerase A
MNRQDHEKQVVARAAAARVESGMRVGLGSGSTAALVVRALGERVRQGLSIVGVPTSRQTEAIAREVGVPLDDLLSTPRLDLTIDGADETDRRLRLVKGGGGALLREKIVASASARVVIVVDASKVVETLGAFPLPVEVVPFAASVVAARIAALGVEPRLRRRPDGAPFVSDEGNHILDCPLGRIADPEALAATLDGIAGVVEHGLFLGLAHEVLVARGDHVESLRVPAS